MKTQNTDLDQLNTISERIRSLSESEASMRTLQASIQEAHQVGQEMVANGRDPNNYYENHLVRSLLNDSTATSLYWIYTTDAQKSNLFRLCQRLALSDIKGLLVHFEQ